MRKPQSHMKKSENQQHLSSNDGSEQPNLFEQSGILAGDKKKLQSVLNEFYGKDQQSWRLVHRASDNDFLADAFHRHCDDIAPLFVIALGSLNEISGGFTDVAYTKATRKGGFIKSERAFLFTLSSPQPFFRISKFDIVDKEKAICYQKDCGPIFGAGADLLISNSCNSNTESYSNLPESYDGPNASSNTLFSDNEFSIKDYEVFTLATDNK